MVMTKMKRRLMALVLFPAAALSVLAVGPVANADSSLNAKLGVVVTNSVQLETDLLCRVAAAHRDASLDCSSRVAVNRSPELAV